MERVAANLKLQEVTGKGRVPNKKCHKKWKSPKGGGGVSAEDQKVQNSKFELFDKRGRLYSNFFPKCKFRL